MRIRLRASYRNPPASPAAPADGCTDQCCCLCSYPSPENPTSSNQPNSTRSPSFAEEGEQAVSAPLGSGVFSSSSSSSTASMQDETDSLVRTLGAWRGHRRRKCRTRSTSWGANTDHFFGLQKPVASGGGKNSRKNNPHWTDEEVVMLVDGVSKYGVGRWTEIKTAYFPTSVRTAVHLKDKWKNLKAACGPEVRSKKKVKAQQATRELIERLEARIIEACCVEKKKASLDDCSCAPASC